MGLTPHPTQINYVQQEHLLKMVFSDGLSAEYPTIYLRGYCPCAKCQGHGAGPPSWIEVTRDAQRVVEDVTQVGAYALCIAWADGHDTGIYTFDSLRKTAKEIEAGLDPSKLKLAKA